MPFRLLRRYWSDERGASALETIILTPVLIWLYVGSFVFFDAFRTYNSSVKATYAMADLLSRQQNTVFLSDIEGYAHAFENLVRNNGDARVRVTQIIYTAATDSLSVDCSFATNGEARLFTPDLANLEGLLPEMVNAERLILVETFIPYRTAFDIGIDLITFRNFTFTRPRFAGKVPFDPTCMTPTA